LVEYYGGGDGGGYVDVDGKWRRLGLLWMTKMDVSLTIGVCFWCWLFTVFVVVDLRAPLAGHTSAHTSARGRMKRHLSLLLILCASHLIYSIFYLLLFIYWLDFVHK
jgi:hypothetical protein